MLNYRLIMDMTYTLIGENIDAHARVIPYLYLSDYPFRFMYP